jgi:hypothetical protein
MRLALTAGTLNSAKTKIESRKTTQIRKNIRLIVFLSRKPLYQAQVRMQAKSAAATSSATDIP